MSTHDEFDVAAYAIDALDPAERAAVEAHLAGCEQCRADLAELRRVVVGLGLSAEPETPPASLRERTIARATAQPQARGVTTPAPREPIIPSNITRFPVPTAPPPQSPTRWSGLATAAGIILSVSLGLYALSLRSQVDSLTQSVSLLSQDALQLRHQIGELQLNNARLLNAVSVAGASDVIRVSLTEQNPAAKGATGRAFMSRTRGMVVSVQGLPSLTPGRAYQLWMIMDKVAPIAAGVFKIASNGSATIEAQLPSSLVVPAGATFSVGITDEPEAGSTGPTTPVLLLGTGKAE